MNIIPNNSVKDKYTRWRKQAKLVSLSPEGTIRLEWIIQYYQGSSISSIAKNFGINRSTIYKWKKRFREDHMQSLESISTESHTKRTGSFCPIKDNRIISLRKQYPYYGKMKLQVLCTRIY